jgi:acetoacetyl-CoA synthetase
MATPAVHSGATQAALNPLKLWEPTPQSIATSAMTRFTQFVSQKRDLPHLLAANYADLYHYSVTQVADFWQDVLEFTEIKYTPAVHKDASITYSVIDEQVPMDAFPDWFPQLRLNFAENLLWCRDPSKVAVIDSNENLEIRETTYANLYVQVQRMAAALTAAGVTIGDRVGAYAANCTEILVAMLAAASIGAVWSSTSPDFGVTVRKELLQRLSCVKDANLLK